MPLKKLTFKPGIVRENTNYANEGGWYDCDKIRFRSGFPEKIGGWTRLSSATYIGTARSLWNWSNLTGDNYLGVGTNVKYYIEYGGKYNDITPLRDVFRLIGTESDLDITTEGGDLLYTDGLNTDIQILASDGSIDSGFYDELTTESGDEIYSETDVGLVLNSLSTLVVSDPNFNSDAENYVTFQNAIGLGGNITADVINQNYEISSVINQTAYTIQAKNPLTGAVVFANNSDVTLATVTVTPGAPATLTFSGFTPIDNDRLLFSSSVTLPEGMVSGLVYFVVNASGSTCNISAQEAGSPEALTTSGVGTLTASLFNPINDITGFYEIDIGLNVYVSGNGWGSGGWGFGGWGQNAPTTFGAQLRLWSNDNFGQDLVIAPRQGGIYYWTASNGLERRAEALSSLSFSAGYDGDYVPTATLQISSSAIQRFIIAFGSNPYIPGTPVSEFDPMLVRWSDQENPYQWIPSSENQSGEFRLSTGSYIVGAKPTRQEILVWTDAALYTMQYIGYPYVWKFELLMDNISVMSPNAMTTVNNVTYWMGLDKFYTYTGRVQTLPCDVRRFVFEDLNIDQAYQTFCGSNEAYNEVWWFYCSRNSIDIDRYVVYNYVDNVWYYGSMARTAWLDSSVRQYPMAADYNNRILYHESSNDDVSGDIAVPINSYIQSSDFDIQDGHNFGFVWRILPDVNFNGSDVDKPEVNMIVKPRQNSGAPYGRADNPRVQSDENFTNQRVYAIQEFDGQVYTRLRARQMAFRIESDTLGVAWQLGAPRIDIRDDGRR